jgi:micrococcal nuclease
MKSRKYVIILIILIFVLIVINYSSLNAWVEKIFINYETGIVERVVDGDTIKVNNESVRLLGINCPEKGEKYSSEAKIFLENRTLGKEIKIYFGKEKYDLYKRKLGYIFIEKENINAEIIKNGFANLYFPKGKDQYYPQFYEAWQSCLKNNLNYCKSSENACANCVFLKNLDVKNQEVIFRNNCTFSCNLDEWKIKDEGRKYFQFFNYSLEPEKEIIVKVGNITNYENIFYWNDESYVWTKTGDTLFLRDEEGNLVLWYSY